MPPALLVENILSIDEVIELFAIFFEHCHRQSPFLDPDIHTPAAVGSRSPFLFTCVCTVASRYYTKRTDDLYRKCLRVAKVSIHPPRPTWPVPQLTGPSLSAARRV